MKITSLKNTNTNLYNDSIFIHSFISSHYPRVQLPAASHCVLLQLLLLSFILSLLPLPAYFLVLSLSAFLSYNSSRFVLLINSTVCYSDSIPCMTLFFDLSLASLSLMVNVRVHLFQVLLLLRRRRIQCVHDLSGFEKR